MEDYRVREGDRVKVFFEHRESLTGDVLYIPTEPGDSWHLTDPETGGVIVLGSFCFMFRFPR